MPVIYSLPWPWLCCCCGCAGWAGWACGAGCFGAALGAGLGAALGAGAGAGAGCCAIAIGAAATAKTDAVATMANARRAGRTGASKAENVILEVPLLRRARGVRPAPRADPIVRCLFAKYGISVAPSPLA